MSVPTLTSRSHLRSSRPPPVSAGRCPVSPGRGPAPLPPAGSCGSETPPHPLPATAHKGKKEKGWGWGKGHRSGNMLLTQKEGSCLGWPRLYTRNQLHQSNYFKHLLAFDWDHNVLKSFAKNTINVFPLFSLFRAFFCVAGFLLSKHDDLWTLTLKLWKLLTAEWEILTLTCPTWPM